MTTSTLRPGRRRFAAALALCSTFALAACGGGSDPLSSASTGSSGQGQTSGGATSAASGTVTVGSADFSESILLAHIYTGALKAKGVQVNEPRLGIGAREAYIKGMTDGSINVIPEYTGALTYFYDKQYSGTDATGVYSHLKTVLPAELTVLEPSQAEDNDSLTVTKETADKLSLHTVSDLQAKAKDMTLGAPPEFKTRPQGIPGLQKTYGVEFGQFRPLKGQALVQALVNGQVQAANIFTTDPAFAQHQLVSLKDDKGLFGSQNVVPLVTQDVAKNTQAVAALNAVSAALTTQDVQKMLSEVDGQKKDPKAVADAFLASKNLG